MSIVSALEKQASCVTRVTSSVYINFLEEVPQENLWVMSENEFGFGLRLI